MEGAFALAKKTYRDNFLQYRLTNEPKYKVAYEQSMDSINKMLEKLENSKPLPSPKKLKEDYLKQEDSLKGASLRKQIPQLPSMSWRYIMLGSLSILAMTLMSF
jgi:hypothetical protein